jgi:UDP-N-acetylglucosamine 2-epimerase (non-hydrolysing)
VFGIASDVDLGVMAAKQNLSELTARTLVGMRVELERVRPSCVVVQGDTTTALAAALAAFYARIPVAHVEAGLRSGQRWSPYPEEINRRVIDQIADLLFAPTRGAAARLVDEGFGTDRVQVTGNTVVDALLAIRDRLRVHPVAIPGLDTALERGAPGGRAPGWDRRQAADPGHRASPRELRRAADRDVPGAARARARSPRHRHRLSGPLESECLGPGAQPARRSGPQSCCYRHSIISSSYRCSRGPTSY